MTSTTRKNPDPLTELWDAIVKPPPVIPDSFETDDVLQWSSVPDPSTWPNRQRDPHGLLWWWATRLADGRWIADTSQIDDHADLVNLLQSLHLDGKLRFLAHYPAASATIVVGRAAKKLTEAP